MSNDWSADLQSRLREFARARDWEHYHTLRNLAALIASESGELLALYRWDEDALLGRRDEVEHELADVLLGVLRFADVAGIDVHKAALRKLSKNAEKYPIGSAGPEAPPPRRAKPETDRVVVCGIDAGTFASTSYVAWLRGYEFLLSSYRQSVADLLPRTPSSWDEPRVIAVDLPQGLAGAGTKRREADAGASTPTRVLPADRRELGEWRLYKGLIEAGVDSFWTIHSTGKGCVLGLGTPSAGRPIVAETYPRYVIKRTWPDFRIPSKRKDPEEYTTQLWSRLQAAGFTSAPEPTRPDHVDAMLCALAARAYLESGGLPPGTVGAPPYVDEDDGLIREGYIVAP